MNALGKSIDPKIIRRYSLNCCDLLKDMTTEREFKKSIVLANKYLSNTICDSDLLENSNRLKEVFLTHSEKMNDEDKVDNVRLWSLGAAINLLQTDTSYHSDGPICAGDPDLDSTWSCACSLVGAYYFDMNEETVLEHVEMAHESMANLLRAMVPYPFT